MCKKITIRIILSILFIFSGINFVFPQSNQTGSLRGTVITSDTKEPLPFANVVIVGTNNGVATDNDGRYLIRNIQSGEQKVKISYIGYQTKTINVDISSNKTTELNVVLEIAVVKGKEVIVTAQRKGQQQAIAQQVSSNTIVNVVAPDRLRQNPDANAAEAIGRLPGISLIRQGGEGQEIVIRGLDPSYSKITLNGIQLPSSDIDTRSLNISGLSEYMLQTVEVFKSITPDMEGNSVAGSVNLTLAPAPEGTKFSLIAGPGYNHQNDYFGNYTINAEGSRRFFDNKLGIRLSIDAERTNRGANTLGGSYGVYSNTKGGLGFEQVLLNNINLDDITRIETKQAGSLVLDWQFSPDSRLLFSNFFSSSGSKNSSFVKEYQPGYYNYYNAKLDNNGKNLLYSGALQGKNDLTFLKLDYGLSFSQVHNYDPLAMNWQFRWLRSPYLPQYTTTSALATLPVDQVINDNLDTGSNTILNQIALIHMGYTQNDVIQKNGEVYLNVKTPYHFSNDLFGNFKFGFEYKNTRRTVNYFAADQPFTAYGYAESTFPWLVPSTDTPQPAVLGFVTGNDVTNFMSGKYNFGWNINYDRLSAYWNWWNNFSNMVIQGDSVIKTVGSDRNISFIPDFYNSAIHNQDITERYYATYLMAVINAGSFITFTPGVRYEKLTDNMTGYKVYDLSQSYSLYLPRQPILSKRSDEFWLPNFHLKIKPLDWLAFQAAYTKTLGRPSYDQMIPDIYVNNGEPPFVYHAGNPDLKPEQWSSYDLQAVVFGNEIGLFSVDGFYKEVKDKIWTRAYTRIPGDPVVPGFRANDEVNVTETINHNHLVYLRGMEFEWQTNFWYLPQPFSFFTVNLNYTILKSETQYPAERLFTVVQIDPATGRPKATLNRVDSTVSGRMLNQPNNIANVSLGFEWKGLNLWVSYQFNGNILTSWNNQQELIGKQNNYQRWDMQATQMLPIKGLKLKFDVANINNAQQISNLNADPRPTYIESYGWTMDLGIIYNL